MMLDRDDRFWSELGVAWRASIADEAQTTARIAAQMRARQWLVRAGMLAAILAGLAGLALAGWAFWAGRSGAVHMLVRGATLSLAALLILATALSLAGSAGGNGRSLRDMLSRSVARAEGFARGATLACIALAVLGVGGTIGYAIRAQGSRPAAVPLAEDLLALAVALLALLWFRQRHRSEAAAYRRLADGFAAAD